MHDDVLKVETNKKILLKKEPNQPLLRVLSNEKCRMKKYSSFLRFLDSPTN